MEAKIVTDLFFGDGGKGMTVDYLCTKTQDPIVVKFTGGPQCGHTVMHADVKHVFASFGSGTFRGAPTYLTEHCLFYPPAALMEYELLQSVLREVPTLYVHPLTKLITPYDVVNGRMLEKGAKHGSCGMGIGATMTRNEHSAYRLYAVDLQNENVLFQKLRAIGKWYKTELYRDESAKAELENEMNAFIQAFYKMKIVGANYTMLNDYDSLIFEGGQGILLDREHGFFPNVTYGHTTSRNAMEVANQMGIDDISVYYVTRCYQTRHGNGWMSNEQAVELINNEEEINVENQWQGKMRVGEFDYDLLNYSLSVDCAYTPNVRKNLVVTCIDQRPGWELDKSKIKHNFEKIIYNHSAKAGNFKSDGTKLLSKSTSSAFIYK
jgi:adenylosuccinate synthase